MPKIDCAPVKEAAAKWLETYDDGEANGEATEKLIEALEALRNATRQKRFLTIKNIFQRKLYGSSAATAGLMISASAA